MIYEFDPETGITWAKNSCAMDSLFTPRLLLNILSTSPQSLPIVRCMSVTAMIKTWDEMEKAIFFFYKKNKGE